MGDTENFIHDKYREKISRYSIYRDTDLWLSTLFYNAQKGEGVDNLLYALYKGWRLSLLMLQNCQKCPFLRYIISGQPLSRARHNNDCRLVSFHCFVEYKVYYSLESARLS